MARRISTVSDVFCPENCIKSPSGCWLWIGRKNPHGYGHFRRNNKCILVHRFVYAEVKGDPEGLFVCHKCDTPACINPDHLFLGTPKDNTRDMVRKGRGVSSSRIAGICKGSYGKWRVVRYYDGKQHHHGYYPSLDAAIEANSKIPFQENARHGG